MEPTQIDKKINLYKNFRILSTMFLVGYFLIMIIADFVASGVLSFNILFREYSTAFIVIVGLFIVLQIYLNSRIQTLKKGN